jgi:hypothetical protein
MLCGCATSARFMLVGGGMCLHFRMPSWLLISDEYEGISAKKRNLHPKR